MFKNANTSNVSRRHFLAVAGSVAAASSLAVGKEEKSEKPPSAPVAPVHYLVTMTVDATNNQISYKAKNTDTDTDVSMPSNALTVKEGDEVKWRAITSGAKPRHRAKVRFTKTSPFKDSTFTWSEGHVGGDIIQPLSAGTSYYYCVAVFDKATGDVFADDPTIIVGGNDASAEIGQAENKLTDVRKQIESVEDLLRDARQKLR
jgi:hypothetical protein